MFLGRLLYVTFVLSSFGAVGSAQSLAFDRGRHKDMLRTVKEDVKKHYFDPSFKGIDLEARHKIAVERIENTQSVGQMNAIIAQFLMDFDDSHLFFVPPEKVNKTDYGFDFQMIGDKCFVVHIDKRSDAEKVGLQVGDQLHTIEGYELARDMLWKFHYTFFRLRPQPGLNVIAIKPNGKPAAYSIRSKVTEGQRVTDLTKATDLAAYIREIDDSYNKNTKQYYFDKLDGVFIWKMPGFSLEPSQVDNLMDKAKKAPAIIFDLRGNSGGRVDMTVRLIGNVFTEDIKVADEKKRKGTKEVIAKSRGKNAYTGKIVVLIDSASASASEVFSRVVQLEKRGQVFGDQSAGAVMESMFYPQEMGVDRLVLFATSITIADLIMKDGKSLEKIGVVPDVKLLPTGKDLAARRDVVLSKALESLGLNVTPESAGAMFPPDEYDDN